MNITKAGRQCIGLISLALGAISTNFYSINIDIVGETVIIIYIAFFLSSALTQVSMVWNKYSIKISLVSLFFYFFMMTVMLTSGGREAMEAITESESALAMAVIFIAWPAVSIFDFYYTSGKSIEAKFKKLNEYIENYK
jgi:uncharacterized membrane protein